MMRVVEILLPKGASRDRGLSPQVVQRVDFLQQRMDSYVDKILAPGTSQAAKDFLKDRLRADFYELRGLIPEVNEIAEGEGNPKQQASVYNPNSKTYRGQPISNLPNIQNEPLDPTHPDLITDPAPDGIEDIKKEIAKHMATLDKTQQLVLKYLYWQDLNYSEIADILGMKKAKVENIAARAMRHLRQLIKRDDFETPNLEPWNFGTYRGYADPKPDSWYTPKEPDDLTEGSRVPTLADKSEKGVPKNPKGGRRQCTDCGKVFSRLGIMRHRCIPKKLDEAVHRLPLSNADFELAKKMLEKPIPAVIAPIYIEGLIEDDELTAQFKSIEESEPARDVRPLIVEWFKRVMPDQMYRFTGDTRDATQEKGILSPIHGYDPKMYKGTNDPITGDAYGRF